MEMPPYLSRSIDEIDAAMFSGDVFLDDEIRSVLFQYTGRWERKMGEWKEISASIKAEQAAKNNS